MRTLKALKPGQKGTKDLSARYGPSLLLVRYRYDDDTRERLKVVEHRSRKHEAKCPRSRKVDDQAGGALRRVVALSIG